MKKLITAALLMSSLSHAATTGSLILQGTVADDTAITVTPSGNTTLNIVTGETGKLVATATEVSNNANGYKIFLSSANAGELRKVGDATKKTAYQINYMGTGMISLTTNPVQVKNVTVLNAQTTTTGNINVNVTAAPTSVSGVYQDTVTISIVAN